MIFSFYFQSIPNRIEQEPFQFIVAHTAVIAETNNFKSNRIQYERHLVNCGAGSVLLLRTIQFINYYLFVFEIIDSIYFVVR